MAEQTVILALDSSEHCEMAINWYIKRMHKPGNRLIFVHVIELPEMSLNQARSLHMSPGVLASMWKEEEAKTKALEEKLKETLKEHGISGMLRTATGKPGETIVRIADEEQAILIVSGTRGMGKVRRTILGSVSDYLVNHAGCPVVVCRNKIRRKSSTSSQEGESVGFLDRLRHMSGGRSRNASGEKSRHTSGDKSRNASGEKKKHDKMKALSVDSGTVNEANNEGDEVFK